MTHKTSAISARIAHLHGRDQPAHLLGWLEAFNAGEYYEAHDILEDLWLQDRNAHEANFYQGLIQLAGAFVHLKMHENPAYPAAGPRLRPAAKLLKLARVNLQPYNPAPHNFDNHSALQLIDHWQTQLESTNFKTNPLESQPPPKL